MFQAILESKNPLKSYVISFAWCSYHTMQKFQSVFKVIFRNVSEEKNGLESYVISPAWCSFHTKHKFQPFFKSCSPMSQKAKSDIRVTWYSPLDVVFILSRNFNHFLSHFGECLRRKRWSKKLHNIPNWM